MGMNLRDSICAGEEMYPVFLRKNNFLKNS